MATFVFSIDFFERLEYKYYNSILFELSNHHCVHKVAFDEKRKLLDVYGKVCKYGKLFSDWVDLLTHKDNLERCLLLKNYPITPDTINDKIIYLMTDEIIGEKKMVVNSHQSIASYYPPKDNNPNKYATIMDYKEADEFINNKNIINNNFNGSIVANGDATINNPTINNQSVTS